MTKYPLAWPAGWPRTEPGKRKYGHFGVVARSGNWPRKRDLTVADGVERVRAELQRLGVREGDSIISTNLPTRLDGLPRSDAKAPADPGVAVYWQVGGAPMRTMAIDIYTAVADNLAAVAATLEAMRAIDRHGGAQVLERAFAGFEALPAPGASKHWRDVLGCDPQLKFSPNHQQIEIVRGLYRSLASKAHPDKGGSHERMSEINRAWEEAQKELT